MERYKEYKDSGVKWIGEVPSHWEVKKGKFSTSIISGFPFDSTLFTYEDDYIPLIRIRDIDSNHTEVYYKGTYPNEAIVENGSILIGMDGDFNIAKWKGQTALLNQRVCRIVSSSEMDSSYAFYMLSFPLKCLNDVTYSTTVKHLSVHDIYNSFLPLPPLAEQTAIANYLDEKCNRIDKVIATQEKRVELLQELKLSIITQAVTKGVNPNVKMKDSGVEWIGHFPEHWELIPLKHCCQTNSGSTPKNIKGKENADSTIKWVRTTDLSCAEVIDSSEYLSYEEYKSASCPWLPTGTVLVAMYGGVGTIGKCGILGVEATINQALCSLESKKLLNASYLFNCIQSMRSYWMKFAVSSRKDPNISQEIIRNAPIPLPSIDEQHNIIVHIEGEIKSINIAINKALRQIVLLKEYRQSLITEVVTGKRKVC